ELSQHWGVSVDSLLYRLRELEIVSESTARRAWITLRKMPRRSQPIRDFPGEQPELLRNAIELLDSVDVSLVDIANDLQFPPQRVRQLAGIDDPQPKLSLVRTSDDRRTTAATSDPVGGNP
ncbi:ImmA/IrrE family metallo-endopeptidase, partial [Leucobacter celer]|uniref:ImmA/IrrE family metallo-endopeptidase n=1 Tax=Leucobacter celer TaxID=668625 RepID=UPI0019D3AC47